MSIDIERDRTALLLVDIQPDFMPGGALATADGDDIVAPVQRLLEAERFGLCAATQDWHPPRHVSFASEHAGREPLETIELYGEEQVLWPDHCVQGTPGAELHPEIDWNRVNVIVRKGMDPRVDSYSGFRDNVGPDGTRPPTGLAGYLRERGVDTVCVCGLARDVCVQWTAEDAAAAGFRTVFIWDLTRPVTYDSDARTRAALEQAGVEVVELADLGG
ncbi:MAG: bifunctional nicotinamidase/pyrazinamidase [Halofilum sp. (in: g-proteobacteria)]|nr:bifunctional nicotinamidase/pyrazinamidase [Halofilum sp. (in: g-proteobacteria)]